MKAGSEKRQTELLVHFFSWNWATDRAYISTNWLNNQECEIRGRYTKEGESYEIVYVEPNGQVIGQYSDNIALMVLQFLFIANSTDIPTMLKVAAKGLKSDPWYRSV